MLFHFTKPITLLGGLVLSAIIGGCGTAQPKFSIEPQERSIPKITGVRIIVSDYMRRSTPHIAVDGFAVLPYDSTVPDFDKLVFSRLASNFTNTDPLNNKELEVAVLEASLYVEHRTSDKIPFASIVSALSARKYKCHIEANFKYNGTSVRKQFTAYDEAGAWWSDLETEHKKHLIENCLDVIINDVNEHVVQLIQGT